MSDLQATAGHKVDLKRGTMRSDLSAQWANRPDDQRFTSLDSLFKHCKARADESREETVYTPEIEIHTDYDDDDTLRIALPGGEPMEPTNYGFDRLCSYAGAPARYLAKLPATLAGINLSHGLRTFDPEDGPSEVMAYIRENGATELRTLTSPQYGRIYDHEVVDALRTHAGDRWKVPGMIDWSNMHHNPNVDVTKDNTTLYASDRDMFAFLCDDRNPIEIGKLDNGDPDLVFRGIIAWNSEVGYRTIGLMTMLLRGVCQNRCLWGVEQVDEIVFRHTKSAPEQFGERVIPVLEHLGDTSPDRTIEAVSAAKDATIADAKDEAGRNEQMVIFFVTAGFSKTQAGVLYERHVEEEGRPPVSVWDAAMAVTAKARDCGHQDTRVRMEGVATKMLNKVSPWGRRAA